MAGEENTVLDFSWLPVKCTINADPNTPDVQMSFSLNPDGSLSLSNGNMTAADLVYEDDENAPICFINLAGACEITATECIWRLSAANDMPLTKDNTQLTIENGKLRVKFEGEDLDFCLPHHPKDAHECGENATATISEDGKITVRIPLPEKVEYPIISIAINEE
jgi:hypothetical protein